jgi:hypothetical protein
MPNRVSVGVFGLGACLVGSGLAMAAPQGIETTQPPGGVAEPSGPVAVGQEAYVYGYPMMLVDATKQSVFKGITNRFGYLATVPSAGDRAVIRPNVDTLYTQAFLDLTAEPVVIHMPDTRGRYDVMQMMDANTNVFASPGKRTTGTGAHDFVVVGPGWKQKVQLTTGMAEIDSPTNSVWIINRTQVNDAKDVPAVNALQRQFSIAPLSEWPAGAINATPLKADLQPALTPPVQVQAMNAPAYFDKLAILLRDNPPPAADGQVLQRFATIGLAPGKAFNPSPDMALALERAKNTSLLAISDNAARLGHEVNGWRILDKDVGTYGTNYMDRAAVAAYGLGANLPADAVYPGATVDGAGQPLTAEKAYVLHFAKDQLPPVNAFWSLTMYDHDGYFVPNALNRYAARDSRLKKNADGSVDIYIQTGSPGKDREANWLPAPKGGPFTLLLRMYWPKQAVLDGTYEVPGVQATR